MLMTASTPVDDATPAREYPHDISVEQALLGAILLNSAAFEAVSFLSPADFFDPLHGRIFEAAGKLIAAGRAATPITLRVYFEADPPLTDAMTVPQYLGRLAATACSIASARDLGQAVRDLAIRRAMIGIGEEMAAAAYDVSIDVAPSLLVEEAERALFSLTERAAEDRLVTFAAAADGAVRQANAAYQRNGGLQGLSTGLIDLDGKFGGLAPGHLHIIAGRPGMGKTALATTIAWNVARAGRVDDDGVIGPARVEFFSLEMSAEELAARIIAHLAEVGSDDMRRGILDEADMRRIVQAQQQFRDTPITIDETAGITISQLATRARRAKRKRGLDLVVIDYLQLLAGSGRENRTQDLTQITMGLKTLAKELDVPVIALSQLSRQVETRADKRPQLSDLRESGSIEQDADVVTFVYREEYYLERSKPTNTGTPEFLAWQGDIERARGKAEAILGKNRHGRTGSVALAFDASTAWFANLAREGS